MLANREALLGQTKRRYADVTINDVIVRIQSLTEGERSDIELSIYDRKLSKDPTKMREANARWISACVVDEHARRMFCDADIASILEMDGGFTESLYVAISRHVRGEEPKVLVKAYGGTTDVA